MSIQQMSRRDRPGGGQFIEAHIAPDLHLRPVGGGCTWWRVGWSSKRGRMGVDQVLAVTRTSSGASGMPAVRSS